MKEKEDLDKSYHVQAELRIQLAEKEADIRQYEKLSWDERMLLLVACFVLLSALCIG